MNVRRFADDVKPITELKTGAGRIVDQIRRSRRPVLLTRRGRGVAVLLDVEDYDLLVERAAFIEAVKAGVRAVRTGETHGDDEAARIFASFGA